MTRKPPSAAKLAKQVARTEKDKLQWIEYEKQMKERGKDANQVIAEQRRIIGEEEDE